MPRQQQNKENIIQLRKLNQSLRDQRIRILVILAVLILIVVGLIVWASYRLGGLQNVFKGNSNVISNTVNNVGNSFTTTETPTPTPTAFTVTDIPTVTVEQKQDINTLVFSTGQDEYSISIKAGTRLYFINNTGKSIGLLFSDGRQTRVETSGENSEVFLKTGTYTFSDQIDTQSSQITGTVQVVN